MFFSLLYIFLCCYFYFTQSGCKNRYFFQKNQEITLFISKVFVFFSDFHYFCNHKAEVCLGADKPLILNL